MGGQDTMQREANRVYVQRYYQKNRAQIVFHKTNLQTRRYIVEKGRVPNAETIERYELDPHWVIDMLQCFYKKNPNSRAGRKIAKHFDM